MNLTKSTVCLDGLFLKLFVLLEGLDKGVNIMGKYYYG